MIILGFEPRAETPAARLQRVFGLDAEAAARLVARVPTTVQRAVSPVRAEYFRRALALLGAEVEVRDPHGRLIAAKPSRPPAAPAPWVDENSPTSRPPSAARASSAAPVARAASAPSPAFAQAGDAPADVRPPAHPTLREASFPEPPAAARPVPVREAPAAAAAEPIWARVPSSVWDPPAAAQPAPAAARAPRVAPNVWEPPADVVQASALEPQTQAPRAAAPAPPKAQPPRVAADFDLARSIAGDVLWRPPAAPASERARPPAAAITLDCDDADAARPVLQPWEQPRLASMAEPDRLPTKASAARAAARRAPAAAAPIALPLADAPARAPRAPELRPASVGLAQPPSTAGSLSRLDLRSFWETLGEALAVPFSGPGVYWLGAITAWSVFVGAIDMLARFALIIGSVVMFFAHTSLLALACDYYRVCLWTPVSGEKVLDTAPSFDPVRLLERYIKSGVHLSLFIIVSQVPLIWWVVDKVLDKVHPLDILADPITWLLAVLPYYYWPMAVGVAALGNNFGAVWNVAAGVRAIARAPLEYTVIVAVGIAVLVGSWVGLLLFGSLFGATGALLSGTIGLPLALSHGIQGALMGHLARARAEVFE